MASLKISLTIPEAFKPLFDPYRYKVFYGGRGSAKSWSVADALIIRAISGTVRILCARELQNSIAESVHKLLSDRIEAHGLSKYFSITNNSIKSLSGSEFFFKGLRSNISEIKSMEGVDICWVEEAQVVSAHSWDTLIPTIRKDGSEIWLTFNPEMETDPTYERFVLHDQPNSIVRHVSYRDNPFFPAVLEQERLALKANDPAAYLNVWEGECKSAVEGAFWAEAIHDADQEGRICEVPYDRDYPVYTYWDIGGTTCIWYVQYLGSGGRLNVIDFSKFYNTKYSEIAQAVIEKPYNYIEHVLPWDAGPTLGPNPHSGQTSEQALLDAGLRRTRVLGKPVDKMSDIHNACPGALARAWFDRGKCADGVNDLRRYKRRQVKATNQWLDEPLKDGSDHAADAWRAVSTDQDRFRIGIQRSYEPEALPSY